MYAQQKRNGQKSYWVFDDSTSAYWSYQPVSNKIKNADKIKQIPKITKFAKKINVQLQAEQPNSVVFMQLKKYHLYHKLTLWSPMHICIPIILYSDIKPLSCNKLHTDHVNKQRYSHKYIKEKPVKKSKLTTTKQLDRHI